MKKFIAVMLCLVMALSWMTACTEDSPAETNNLENAKAYIVNMYQTGSKNEPMKMLMDKDVLASVTIEGVKYDIAWTITVTQGASDDVKVVDSDEPNHVKIDVPDLPDTDILFTLTATVKDADGKTESANFSYIVPGLNISSGPSPEEILNNAYAIPENGSLEGTFTLTGKVISIDTEYSEQYGNITVTMVVEGFDDKPIQCYRLAGDGADTLAVGDTITVTGSFSNYKGKVQYSQGSVLNLVVKGDGGSTTDPETSETPDENPGENSNGGETSNDGGNTQTPVTKTESEIIDEAYALAEGESLSYTATLTGKVISIDDAYSAEFKNITVTIQVSGKADKPIKCYRLKGTDADKIAKDDIITVTGTLKNHYGTVEFDLGCTVTKRISGGGSATTVLTNPADIMNFAYNMEAGGSMEYDVTLEGKVTKVSSAYDPQYKNISVYIAVTGSDKELLLYRMKGDEADKVVKGDTITVTGRIINYNGTIEMEAGCTMRKRVSGGGTVVTAPTDPKEIVKAAYELAAGDALPYRATLTGKIISIDTEYSEQYGNITVTIEIDGCEDKPIKCYRMKGEGAAALKVGDVITVSGTIKNYQHSSGDTEVEFDSGCTFVK